VDAASDGLRELAAGSHPTADPDERARRQDRLQRAEATFEALPMDAAVDRAYGRIYAAVAGTGLKARGRHAFRSAHREYRHSRPSYSSIRVTPTSSGSLTRSSRYRCGADP
jgi:hypothetical protein